MPTVKLSAAVVKNTACPHGKLYWDLYDTAISGFLVEINRTFLNAFIKFFLLERPTTLPAETGMAREGRSAVG